MWRVEFENGQWFYVPGDNDVEVSWKARFQAWEVCGKWLAIKSVKKEA